MKPASRIQAGIEILENLEKSPVPMDTVIGDYMRRRRYIGSKDRAEVATRAYHIARRYARIGWWLEKYNMPDTPRARMITQLALAEDVPTKRILDLFDGSKYAPDPVAETKSAPEAEESDSAQISERHYMKLIDGKDLHAPDMPEAVKCECPPQHEDNLRKIFGDDFVTEMEAMLKSATLDLRVNTFLATRDKVKSFLEADGVKTEETPFSSTGLRCANKTYLSRTKAWGKGWIEIQDEGSQLIAQITGAQPGMQVMDYCAGAGGKTLALGAMMQRKGRIVAMDNDNRRLQKGRDRYKKAHIADIIEVRCLEDDKVRKWFKRQKGKFDIVLTDVPCSGSGTWRRNPDMRWVTYGPSLEDLTTIQAEILDKASRAVKPGGKLVYATCSLFREENENQIERFLAENPDFELQPLDPDLGLGSPYMRLTPHRHKTDGFFTALMTRKETEV